MGIIGKSHRNDSATATGAKPAVSTDSTTLIAANSEINGSLTLKDNLHIDGRVEGEIQSKGDVSIGESGFFEGVIKAASIVVSGHMQGTIDCQRLEVVATGHVHGNLITDDLIIASGGRFIGESKIRNDNTVKLIDGSKKQKNPEKGPRDDQADTA